MPDQPSLYGDPPSKKKPPTQPSSSTLAFTNTLTSLLAKEDQSSARPRPKSKSNPHPQSKSDLFARPNRGAEKRAAADLADDSNNPHYARQSHQRSTDIGGKVDEATLARSKRRMAEKVRMYEDLKGGLYLGESSDEDDPRAGENLTEGERYLARLRRKEREGLIDFDRKWAERSSHSGSDREDNEGEGEEEDDNASIISYEDDLGRTRRGTRREAARAAQQKAAAAEADGDTRTNYQERWRPSRPENLIYGATVQSEAFQPGAGTAAQMDDLARRRDRSATPPGETHYDAEWEVRNRGTGFYAFSKDEETRRKQMEELMNVRDETMKEREARKARKLERGRMREERRARVEELRAKRRAESFLSGLGDVGVLG